MTVSETPPVNRGGIFSTYNVNSSKAIPPFLSSIFIETVLVSTSPFVGVPEITPFAVSNDSHDK